MKINETTLNLGLQIVLSTINTIGYAMRTHDLTSTRQSIHERQETVARNDDVSRSESPKAEERIAYRTIARKAPAHASFHTPAVIPVGCMDVAEQIAGLRDLQSHVYRRLEEYRIETDEAEQLLLCNEMAAGIRRALDKGTRCILDQCMKEPYADARLSERIDMCLPFLGSEAIDSLHQARVLCNRILHGEDVSNTAARFTAAARIPGLLVRFIEAIVDENGTEPWE